MRKTLAFIAVIAIVAILTAPGVAVAATVTVTIVDAESLEPIEGAEVHVADAEHRLGIKASADEDGRATLEDLPAGTLRLTFKADGYRKRQYTLTADTIDDAFRVRLNPRPEKGEK